MLAFLEFNWGYNGIPPINIKRTHKEIFCWYDGYKYNFCTVLLPLTGQSATVYSVCVTYGCTVNADKRMANRIYQIFCRRHQFLESLAQLKIKIKKQGENSLRFCCSKHGYLHRFLFINLKERMGCTLSTWIHKSYFQFYKQYCAGDCILFLHSRLFVNCSKLDHDRT